MGIRAKRFRLKFDPSNAGTEHLETDAGLLSLTSHQLSRRSRPFPRATHACGTKVSKLTHQSRNSYIQHPIL
jgi:hypothetical protein